MLTVLNLNFINSMHDAKKLKNNLQAKAFNYF